MVVSLLCRLSDNYPLREEDDNSWNIHNPEALLRELKMLLISRVRLQDIENIPQVNSSVLNYGIDESFNNIENISLRLPMMEMRLKNAISRFEPRLTDVEIIGYTNNEHSMNFILHAQYLRQPISLELRWDDCTGGFHFNE